MAEIATAVTTCGACPVQIEGTLTDGRKFYFRYRYARATLAAGKFPEGATSPRADLDVVSRTFSDRDEMSGSLESGEATELLASMAAELGGWTGPLLPTERVNVRVNVLDPEKMAAMPWLEATCPGFLEDEEAGPKWCGRCQLRRHLHTDVSADFDA